MTERDEESARLARATKGSAVAIAVLVFVALLAVFFSQREIEQEEVTETKIRPSVVHELEVAMPSLLFTDVTEVSGIDFVHENGAVGDRLLPETMGGGVALFDYDIDGDLDLLFINSNTWFDDKKTDGEVARSELYENSGRGQFTDVTSGQLDLTSYGMAPAIGDINGDGYPDLFVTTVGTNRLFLNDIGRGFVDVTDAYGVGGDSSSFSTCATFLDYDRDNDLDLFVCNYVGWSVDIDRKVDFRLTGVGRAYGPPTDFPGSTSWLYRNDGDTFTDVTDMAGISVLHGQTGNPIGKALAVAVNDINNDGWPDLIVANDTTRNFVYVNQSNGSFREQGIELGLAFDASGAATGAMGLDVGNYSNDQRFGIVIGNFANEMSSFYVGVPSGGIFSDDAIVVGIGADTRKVLTFGLFFFDADLDGRLDIFSVNGHIEPEISTVQVSQSYRQKPQLFWNCGIKCARLFQAVPTSNTALDLAGVARGAVFGDLDSDGDLDIVITNVGDRPRILRNDLPNSRTWLNISLRYLDSNRFGIGSTIRVKRGDVTQTRYITRTRSYLSQVDATAHFGLGGATGIEAVEVTWPNGEIELFADISTNRTVVLEFDKGMPDS